MPAGNCFFVYTSIENVRNNYSLLFSRLTVRNILLNSHESTPKGFQYQQSCTCMILMSSFLSCNGCSSMYYFCCIRYPSICQDVAGNVLQNLTWINTVGISSAGITVQKMNCSRKLWISSHLLKKSLMKTFFAGYRNEHNKRHLVRTITGIFTRK